MAVAATFLAQIPIVNPLAIFNKERATGSLDDFLASEGPIALQGVLNNIGSAGSKAAGAESGLVVASPSRSNPDCQYLLLCDLHMQYFVGYLYPL